MALAFRCRRPRIHRAGHSAITVQKRPQSNSICCGKPVSPASQPRCYNPGHIVGPGWEPLNPAGHFNPEVFERLARGEEVILPNLGLETVHHVHADDVAKAFVQAMVHRSVAIGENFHVVSAAALSLRGYAETVSAWFGKNASLRFLSWDEWRKTVSKEDAAATWDHIAH